MTKEDLRIKRDDAINEQITNITKHIFGLNEPYGTFRTNILLDYDDLNKIENGVKKNTDYRIVVGAGTTDYIWKLDSYNG